VLKSQIVESVWSQPCSDFAPQKKNLKKKVIVLKLCKPTELHSMSTEKLLYFFD